MSKITSASIRPVVSGVGYHQGRVPKSEEFAQIDQQLATYGLDACGDDTLTGNLSVQQDPNHPALAPSISGNFGVTASGAVAGTGAAGSLICTGSVPVYWNIGGNVAAPRTRRVRISMLEATRSNPHFSASVLANGNAPLVDVASGGITTITSATTNQMAGAAEITVPLTKPHDGAQFDSMSLYYYVPGKPAAPPGLNGTFRLESVDLSTGAVVTLGGTLANIPATGSADAWWALGQPQVVTVSGMSATINLSAFAYRFVISEPACVPPTQLPFPVWTGIEVNFKNILDERFSQ